MFPSAIAAVPNTYAALLKGPPISVAIIAARTIERRILLVSPRDASPFASPELSIPINGFTASINTPISSVPKSG